MVVVLWWGGVLGCWLVEWGVEGRRVVVQVRISRLVLIHISKKDCLENINLEKKKRERRIFAHDHLFFYLSLCTPQVCFHTTVPNAQLCFWRERGKERVREGEGVSEGVSTCDLLRV